MHSVKGKVFMKVDPKVQYNLILKHAEMISPSTRHLVFALENDGVLAYTPGQFIRFHFEREGQSYKRSYSIATIAGTSNDIEIAAAHFEGGPGTEYLFNLKLGDAVTTSGPFGRLVLRDENPTRYVLVATGTGIAPYRSMLQELKKRLEQNPTLKVVLLFGARAPEDLLYAQDFLSLVEQQPRFEFMACFSRQMPEEVMDYVHKGYVQQRFPELNLNPDSDVVYLCGNPNMIDEAFTQLKDMNFATTKIRREKYIS